MQPPKKPGQILGYQVLNPKRPAQPLESAVPDIRTPWIPFFDDSNNLFINQLVHHYENSSTHRTAINTKLVYTVGDGFIVNRKDGQPYQKDDKLEHWLAEVNAEGESLQELFERWALDYILTGNFAIETAEEGPRLNLYHRDVTEVRLGKPTGAAIKKAFLSQHWGQVLNGRNTGSKYEVKEIPIFQFDDAQEHAMLYVRDYRTGRRFYGLPDYYTLGGMKWVTIEYKIPAFNLDRMDNKFVPSGLLTMFGEPPKGMKTEEYLNSFIKSFTGEGNNSKLIAQIVSNESQAPQYIPVNDEPEGIFRELQDLAVQNLLRAHRTHPALLVETSGKLSSSSEVRTLFEIYMNTVIINYQNTLLKPLNKLLAYAGYGEYELAISNVMPISFIGSVDVNAVIQANEARRELGLEPLPELEGRSVGSGEV